MQRRSTLSARAVGALICGSVIIARFAEAALAQSGAPVITTDQADRFPVLAADALASNPSLRGLVATRGDCVLFEYYRHDLSVTVVNPVFSVSKSVLSILVGIAIDKGYLRLDEKLSEIMTEAFDKSVDLQAADITIRDLLTITSGFDGSTSHRLPILNMWKNMLSRSVKYSPGAHFQYDSVSVNLLSVALSLAIKGKAEQFAADNLFEPLGIRDFQWVTDAEGHLLEGHLSLTPRDMARLGILYLEGGRWGERQIVSEPLFWDSLGPASAERLQAAYGYLWWVQKLSLATCISCRRSQQSSHIRCA